MKKKYDQISNDGKTLPNVSYKLFVLVIDYSELWLNPKSSNFKFTIASNFFKKEDKMLKHISVFL